MKYVIGLLGLLYACKPQDKTEPIETFYYKSVQIDQQTVNSSAVYGVGRQPNITISFAAPVDQSSARNAIKLIASTSATEIPVTYSFGTADSTVVITPQSPLNALSAYSLEIQATLISKKQTPLNTSVQARLITEIDQTDKFPILSDSLLLDQVQKQTFAYFWDFGHPTSGMARERNSSGDVVTSGGTGFGIMAIIVAVKRGFITRKEGLDRISKIASFLKDKTKSYHGAFPHWINGATGETIPFSTKDDGADLVETSYLMQGLLTARQFFNTTDATETTLRQTINTLWDNVEWDWFTQGGQNVLYWHWSPNYNWDMNMPIRGWNEALITYVMAASSRTHTISQAVYQSGWAQNGKMANGNTYYGIKLPLGSALGGPLFFEHYSFLGINPRGLSDTYANYEEQTKAHTLINYNYCKANPKNYYGYSENCWGLTASDNPSGYSAHEPNNDLGVITPTAALASMPYTPTESMNALRFFYYKLGDKLWKTYGFVDAFNLSNLWFADSFLAIDQGPIIVMMENYRSQQIWNLFMSCPEVSTGMKNLGFQSPNLK
ncbi:MAG: glucoamylase family protein [Siphonobacter sp.]